MDSYTWVRYEPTSYGLNDTTYQHHHHVEPPARISITLSRHFSQSFIASGRSSGLHPVSSQSCCMYVRAGLPAFARPYVEIYRSTSPMSSSLLLQQCPACLVRLTWIVFATKIDLPLNKEIKPNQTKLILTSWQPFLVGKWHEYKYNKFIM